MARVYLTSTTTGNPLNQATVAFITLQSEIIYKNEETITQATLNTTYTITGDEPVFYLSSDGGTNFEQVTVGVIHTFTNTGQEVKYKVIGVGTIITKLEVIIA